MNTKVVGRRVVAFLIDSVLVFGVNIALFFAFAEKGVTIPADANLRAEFTLNDTTYGFFGGKAGLYFLLAIGLPLLYFVVFQGLKGFTLGKLALGLRVVKDDGSSPPGIGRALGRWFLYIADGFPYFIPHLTGFVVALTNDENKRLGDMVAGTLVVDKDTVGAGPVHVDTSPTWVDGTRS